MVAHTATRARDLPPTPPLPAVAAVATAAASSFSSRQDVRAHGGP